MAREDAGQGKHADWLLVLSARAAILGHEEVQHLDRVQHFRRHVPDDLLSADARTVRTWIAKASEEAEQSSIRRDPAKELDLEDLAAAMRQPHLGRTPRVVPDPANAPDEPVRLSIYVQLAGRAFAMPAFEIQPYGALGELFWIGVFLQSEYGWEPAFARGWALVRGAWPVVEPVKIRSYSSEMAHPPDAHRHRVLLDVSLDTPPARLEQEFREIRDHHYERAWLPPRKPIAEWNLRATVFATRLNDGRAWGDVVDAWNASVKESSWRYEDSVEGAHLFGKTVRRTYRALIGKPMKWKRKPAEHRTK